MASPLFADPTATMNPAQREELRATSAPIGPVHEAEVELVQLEARSRDIKASLKAAYRTYDGEVLLPDSVPEETRERVRESAEAALAAVEATSRRDLAISVARARSISAQLEAAAAEPDISGVPSHVLNSANTLLPLLQSQLSGQPLKVVAARLKAAVVRDDPSELLALSMAVHPLLAERREADDPDIYLVGDLRSALRQIVSRWRSTAIDAAVVGSRNVERDLVDLDRRILRGNQERTGDQDPYNYSID